MNRSLIRVAFFVLVLMGGQNVLGQSGHDLFQKGLIQERTEGDLDKAIGLYQQIVEDFPDDRPLAAKALLQIGECYEKLGDQEAQKAYQRLIKEFADQLEVVRIARQHLQQLNAGDTGTQVNGPTYSLVLDDQIAGMEVGFFEFSPSGDRIVFASENKLYIADHTATVIRPILEDLEPWENPVWLRWSPDGELIAFVAMREITLEHGNDAVAAIFVVNPDGGAPRQIGPERNERIRWISWTPESKHVSYFTRDGLHVFNLDGSEVRFLPREDFPAKGWRRWETCEYSPNGRWLTYLATDETVKNDQPDLWILPATGGQAQQITDLPGPVGHPKWAQDGRTIYFNYIGNIVKISIDPETGLVKGQPQQVTTFKDTNVKWPRLLGDGDRMALRMKKSNTSIHVADTSSPSESRTLVRSARCEPQLSPDGLTVYYVNDTSGKEGIYAVSRQGGEPRRLTESIPGLDYPIDPLDLSTDGQFLAYVTKLGNELGLVTLPTSGGEPNLLVKIAISENFLYAKWSPDGSQLAYAEGKVLYVIAATGGPPRELARVSEGWDQCIRWSPDGKFIAAFGFPEPEKDNAIFVVPASGGKLRQLTTPSQYYLQGLEWHPDGKRLTYHVSLYNSETRVAYLDGRPSSRLIDAPGIWDYEGAWAPDGLQYFFVGHTSSQPGGIYVFNEASGKTTLVDPVGNDVGVPCFSRDGKTMVWWETRTTNSQIWVMENFLP